MIKTEFEMYFNVNLLILQSVLKSVKNQWSHFILDGLSYYVLTFKLIIWYNALIVYMFLYCTYI